jgi:hypothetical protein
MVSQPATHTAQGRSEDGRAALVAQLSVGALCAHIIHSCRCCMWRVACARGKHWSMYSSTCYSYCCCCYSCCYYSCVLQLLLQLLLSASDMHVCVALRCGFRRGRVSTTPPRPTAGWRSFRASHSTSSSEAPLSLSSCRHAPSTHMRCAEARSTSQVSTACVLCGRASKLSQCTWLPVCCPSPLLRRS